MNTAIDGTILNHLCVNEQFASAALPYLKEEYFLDKVSRLFFRCVKEYTEKYQKLVTRNVLKVCADNLQLSDDEHTRFLEMIADSVQPDTVTEFEWLKNEAEKFCRDRAVYNTLMEASDKLQTGEMSSEITDKLMDALGITFEVTLGHDFFDDAEKQYDAYHSVVAKFPSNLETMNIITNGGVEKGTLNILMSSDTGGFKSGTMCHMAACDLMNGRNVLYISLEMSESKVRERIDANLMKMNINDIPNLPKDDYISKIASFKTMTPGRLNIKQFPTAAAHVGHFRYYIKDLMLKSKFKVDIIYLDYLGITASSRNVPMHKEHIFYRAVSEEVRGLAIELDIPIWTGIQSNRDGSENLDLSVTDIASSYGINYTGDLIIGIITTEQLDAEGKLLFRVLKNRYADNRHKTFAVGVNKAQMTLFDIAQEATTILKEKEEECKATLGLASERPKSLFGGFKFK